MSLTETLLWLLNIPSPPGQEQELSHALAQRLSGLEQRANPIGRRGDSLWVSLSANTGGPKIVLVGHLDVAAIAPRASARSEGDRVQGPGASDAKGGLALMIDLAERAPRLPQLGVDLSLIFHARGQAGYHADELAEVLSAEPDLVRADLAVVLQPTDNRVQLGSGGTTHATFRFAGQSGHSGSCQLTPRDNAILRALPLLNDLAAREPVPDVVAGLTWYEFFTVTRADAGREGCFSPEQFDINVQHQYGPSGDPHDSQDKLLALADRKAIVRFEELAPAAAPVRGHALVDALVQASGVSVGAHQTHSAVARFAELGTAAVNFGPGAAEQSHRSGEWIDVAGLERARQILDHWLSQIGRLA